LGNFAEDASRYTQSIVSSKQQLAFRTQTQPSQKPMAQLTQLTRLERLAALSLERQEDPVSAAGPSAEGAKDENARAGDKRRSVSCLSRLFSLTFETLDGR
jgi:hypothetical protein